MSIPQVPTSAGAEPISWGVVLPVFKTPDSSWNQIAVVADAAESHEFDRLWIGDHLAGSTPNIESLVVLGYVAGITRRSRLCLGVIVAALRQPAWLAKQLQAVDVLSSGRLEIGIGLGGEFLEEWHAVGIPQAERAARTDEFIEVLPHLMKGESANVRGRFLSADIPALTPPSPQGMPPLWVGGRSEAALRRAARYGQGWITLWASPKNVKESSLLLANMACEHGRRPPRVGVSLVVCIQDDRWQARVALERFVNAFGVSIDRLAGRVAIGTEREVQDQIQALIVAGVDTLAISFAGQNLVEQIERAASIKSRLQNKRLALPPAT